MKTTAGFVVLLLFLIIFGILVRNTNVESEGVEGETQGEPSSLVLSYGREGLVAKKPLIYEGERHFQNIRQLTFGGENAEAYFSSDGERLILQAHQGKDSCDQIYVMNVETGEMEQVSTGYGVTTCSFFQYPQDDAIVYASTHLAGQECPPRADPGLGYVWTLYPSYDIFKASPDGSNLVRLTESDGYDAEGTYAFDGSKIVYTSMASGDLEIWTMDPDGSGKRQLTDRLGYDGGPFYSHDGEKIVWRAFYPETEEGKERYLEDLRKNAMRPVNLQIWIMNSDGSGQTQVTDNGAANFAPFFFPDDSRIIFASNLGGGRGNFDLYAIDPDGSNLEQISFFDGFDSFPMFSPDGKRLAFASNRNSTEPGETNIFICDWVE
ncbi:MAG: TolB family protein [Fidelibacterota bacterium]